MRSHIKLNLTDGQKLFILVFFMVVYVSARYLLSLASSHFIAGEDVGLNLENKGVQFHFTLANEHLKLSAMQDFHSFRLNQLFCLERFSTCCWHHKLFCITGKKRSFIVSLSLEVLIIFVTATFPSTYTCL